MHSIIWQLTRTSPGTIDDEDAPPVVVYGYLDCYEGPDAPCRQTGPWVAHLGEGAVSRNHDEMHECWATVWVNTYGADLLWDGAETTLLTASDEVVVTWDGGDWVWRYEDEEPARRTPEARLDRVALGIIEIHHTVDDATAAVADAERMMAEIKERQ